MEKLVNIMKAMCGYDRDYLINGDPVIYGEHNFPKILKRLKNTNQVVTLYTTHTNNKKKPLKIHLTRGSLHISQNHDKLITKALNASRRSGKSFETEFSKLKAGQATSRIIGIGKAIYQMMVSGFMTNNDIAHDLNKSSRTVNRIIGNSDKSKSRLPPINPVIRISEITDNVFNKFNIYYKDYYRERTFNPISNENAVDSSDERGFERWSKWYYPFMKAPILFPKGFIHYRYQNKNRLYQLINNKREKTSKKQWVRHPYIIKLLKKKVGYYKHSNLVIGRFKPQLAVDTITYLNWKNNVLNPVVIKQEKYIKSKDKHLSNKQLVKIAVLKLKYQHSKHDAVNMGEQLLNLDDKLEKLCENKLTNKSKHKDIANDILSYLLDLNIPSWIRYTIRKHNNKKNRQINKEFNEITNKL